MTEYTNGHCPNHNQPGGCQLHNLMCGWPSCDRRPVQPQPPSGASVSEVTRYHEEISGMVAGPALYEGQQEWVKWEDHQHALSSPRQEVDGPSITYDEHERQILQVIDQRDQYHEVADDLAAAIAILTNTDIGEHSSMNCPWQNAIQAAEEYKPPVSTAASTQGEK